MSRTIDTEHAPPWRLLQAIIEAGGQLTLGFMTMYQEGELLRVADRNNCGYMTVVHDQDNLVEALTHLWKLRPPQTRQEQNTTIITQDSVLALQLQVRQLEAALAAVSETARQTAQTTNQPAVLRATLAAVAQTCAAALETSRSSRE